MAKKNKRVNRAWLHDHLTDPYVRRAQQEGYRSRAAYKLAEIDEAHGLVRSGQVIVDLGSVPGAWSQYSFTALTASQVNQFEQTFPDGYLFDSSFEVVRTIGPGGNDIAQAEYYRFDDRTLAADELLSGGGGSGGSVTITTGGGGTVDTQGPVDIAAILAGLPAIFTPDGFDLLGL